MNLEGKRSRLAKPATWSRNLFARPQALSTGGGRSELARLTAKAKRQWLVCALPFLLIAGPAGSQNQSGTTPQDGVKASTAVLVELFTSEGCSSCPPADKLLADLERTQRIKDVEVIALSEHVDYWNRLGWKDPFSSAEFTRRQSEYATALRLDDYYTPQMIVDGQAAFVGSSSRLALEAITKAARSPKAVAKAALKGSTAKSVTVAVTIENCPDVSNGDTADVMLAVTESGLSSKVSRGENSGRELAHSSVTRKLIQIGSLKNGLFTAEARVDLNPNWKRQNMKAVAFVQERRSRRVLGATAVKLAGEL
jgi:hypothetical protein